MPTETCFVYGSVSRYTHGVQFIRSLIKRLQKLIVPPLTSRKRFVRPFPLMKGMPTQASPTSPCTSAGSCGQAVRSMNWYSRIQSIVYHGIFYCDTSRIPMKSAIAVLKASPPSHNTNTHKVVTLSTCGPSLRKEREKEFPSELRAPLSHMCAR